MSGRQTSTRVCLAESCQPCLLTTEVIEIRVFPGTVSKFFANLDVGDQVEMQGPIKKLQYEPNKYRHIVMLAGGSGLTPMTQVADKILRTDGDNTKVTLLFANRTEDDILARDWCVMLVLFSV